MRNTLIALASALLVVLFVGCADDTTNNGANNGTNNGAADTGCLPSGEGQFVATLTGELEASLDVDNDALVCSGSATATTVINLAFSTKVPGTEDDLSFIFGLDGLTEGQTGTFAASATVVRSGSAFSQWNGPAGACSFMVTAQDTYSTTAVGNVAQVEGTGDCATALEDGALEVHGITFATKVVFAP